MYRMLKVRKELNGADTSETELSQILVFMFQSTCSQRENKKEEMLRAKVWTEGATVFKYHKDDIFGEEGTRTASNEGGWVRKSPGL